MKKDKLYNIISNIFIYVSILLANFLSIFKILDADLFFDLRSAKDILTYGLDFKDHMSMHEGLKYLYHHWLYDLIIYPIFKIGSYPLLFFFVLLLFFIFSIIIYKYINNRIKNKYISLIFVIILSYFMGHCFMPRVQSLSYLVILLEFVVIEKLYTTGKIKYSIISIILSIFMVNIHFPLWIMIPIFYLPYIANIFINYFVNKYKLNILNKKIEYINCNNIKLFMITFIFILLSCLVSPYGLLPYLFGFEVSSLYSTIYYKIGEMRLVTFGEMKYIFLFFAILIGFMIGSKNKIKLYQLFYLIGIGILGFTYMRNTPFLYTYYILIIVPIIFKDLKINLIKININKNIIISIITILVISLLVASITTIDYREYQYGADNGGEPIEVADYIIDNLDYKNIRLYNEFAQGSYLAYRNIPVFIDSRVEVYISKFNGKENIIVDYHNMKPEELIKKYKFDYYLVIPGTKMYDYLKDNNYELIYSSYNYYYLYKNKEA